MKKLTTEADAIVAMAKQGGGASAAQMKTAGYKPNAADIIKWVKDHSTGNVVLTSTGKGKARRYHA